jgi:hypothetical protein
MKNKSKGSKSKTGMKDLELFYARKKEEQEALRNLLKALDKRSTKENTNKSDK